MKGDIAQAGMEFSQYLTMIKKTEEDMKKDLLPDAEKRAKTELIMMEIAKEEKLEPNKEIVENETKRLIQTYQDADPLRARAYITHMLLNEEIFKFLEAQK
jgi:trigger factor